MGSLGIVTPGPDRSTTGTSMYKHRCLQKGKVVLKSLPKTEAKSGGFPACCESLEHHLTRENNTKKILYFIIDSFIGLIVIQTYVPFGREFFTAMFSIFLLCYFVPFIFYGIHFLKIWNVLLRIKVIYDAYAASRLTDEKMMRGSPPLI